MIQYYDRFLLYEEYIKYLSQFDKDLKSMSEDTMAEIVADYSMDPDCDWIDIGGSQDPIGFLVICNKEMTSECHPMADYQIAQAYIRGEYRRQGFMTKTVTEYINNHKGIYSFDVIKGNLTARAFWIDLFNKMGAEMYPLAEIRENVECLELFGYSV